jgi:hypothetical protein
MAALVETTPIASMIPPRFFHQRAMIEMPQPAGMRTLN